MVPETGVFDAPPHAVSANAPAPAPEMSIQLLDLPWFIAQFSPGSAPGWAKPLECSA